MPTIQTTRIEHAVPATILADLLGRDRSSATVGARRYGLANWVDAQIRTVLTEQVDWRDYWGAVLTVERNLDKLLLRADLVSNRPRSHSRRQPVRDAHALAQLFGLQRLMRCRLSFFSVWTTHMRQVADAIVKAGSWAVAGILSARALERCIDEVVCPRARMLRWFAANPNHRLYLNTAAEPLPFDAEWQPPFALEPRPRRNCDDFDDLAPDGAVRHVRPNGRKRRPGSAALQEHP